MLEKTLYCYLICMILVTRNQAFCMHDYYHIQDVQQASLHVLTDNASQLAGGVMVKMIALMEVMRLVAVSFCHYSSYLVGTAWLLYTKLYITVFSLCQIRV